MLEDIEDILGVTFRDDVIIERVNLEFSDNEKRLRKSGETLYLNIEECSEDEREHLRSLVRDKFDGSHVLRLDEHEEAQAMETGYEHDLDEILTYWDGILSPNYHEILERSLYLRGLINEKDLSKEMIQERKGQIARECGSEAMYVSSVVTAGYFDPNGGLRDLFVEMGLNKEYDKLNFQSELKKYIEKELLCVFVENDDSVYSVTQDVRGGLSRYQQEEPIQDWFDVRGIGDGCAKIIDGVIENLEEEFIGIDYYQWRDDDDLWVRIDPRSLPPISG